MTPESLRSLCLAGLLGRFADGFTLSEGFLRLWNRYESRQGLDREQAEEDFLRAAGQALKQTLQVILLCTAAYLLSSDGHVSCVVFIKVTSAHQAGLWCRTFLIYELSGKTVAISILHSLELDVKWVTRQLVCLICICTPLQRPAVNSHAAPKCTAWVHPQRHLTQHHSWSVQGLLVLHSCNMAHCDIKGDNIKATMQRDGTHMHAVLVDLGCCLALGASELCLSLALLDCNLPTIAHVYDMTHARLVKHSARMVGMWHPHL